MLPLDGVGFCTPTIFIPPLVNNEYPVMSLNWVTHSEQCKSWCDYILQWNEHARLYLLIATTFLADPLSINLLPFHPTFDLNFRMGSHIYVR